MCNSLPESIKIFTQMFQLMSPGREAAKALVSLGQGILSVIDYPIGFRTIPTSLIDALLNGLSDTLKDHLVLLDLSADLEALN